MTRGNQSLITILTKILLTCNLKILTLDRFYFMMIMTMSIRLWLHQQYKVVSLVESDQKQSKILKKSEFEGVMALHEKTSGGDSE